MRNRTVAVVSSLSTVYVVVGTFCVGADVSDAADRREKWSLRQQAFNFIIGPVTVALSLVEATPPRRNLANRLLDRLDTVYRRLCR